MPAPNLVLMVLIGLAFGGITAVFLRGGFIVNVLLGMAGASLGAFMPILLGGANAVDVSTYDYLLRALLGAFLLVVAASLFRSAKPSSS